MQTCFCKLQIHDLWTIAEEHRRESGGGNYFRDDKGMRRRVPIFKTEAEMCSSFMTEIRKYPGWVCYPETAGWDILLARSDGTQIGVQAKLKFNISVLSQAIESRTSWGSYTGPDYRAVLIPDDHRTNRSLCEALGLEMITARRNYNGIIEFRPRLDDRDVFDHWHYCNPDKRHELPYYIPDVAAGVPAPTQLTMWKIAALEICAVIELRGFVRRQDFSLAGIDHRRWTQFWLEVVPDNPGAYRWKKEKQKFAEQHPEVYPQVLEKVRARL